MAVATEVGSFTKAVATGNQDITITTNLSAATAGTWAVIFWTGGSTAASGSWTAWGVESCIGFVANGPSGTISEFSTSALAQDNIATTVTARRTATACITIPDSSGASVWEQANFTGFTSSTNMRINWSTASTDAIVINYMIVSGLTGAKVVNQVMGGGTGTHTITGAGFSPDLVLLATSFVSSGSTSMTHSYMSTGAVNKLGQQWTNGFNSTDAVTPANSTRYQLTDACIGGVTATDTLMLKASWTGMTSDGFTMNATTNSIGATWYMIALMMDGVGSQVGSWLDPASSGSITRQTRHGFTPRAVMFSGSHSPSTTTPTVHSTWFMGASDLTNNRSASLYDQDAVNPSNTGAIWRNDAVIAHGYAATMVTYASLTSATTSSITLNYGAANATPFETLYLIIGDDNQSLTVTTEVGSFTKQAGTGNQDITISADLTAAAPGTWAVIFWLGGSDQSSGTWDAHIGAGLGYVANGGGAISQYTISASSDDAQVTANNARRTATAAIGTANSNDGSAHSEATFSGFVSSTTMRLNWSSAGGGTLFNISYMIIYGLTGARAITWTTPTSATTKAVTGVNFSADLVLTGYGRGFASPAGYTNFAFGWGAFNKHGQQWASTIFSADAATANTSRQLRTDACLLGLAGSESQQEKAHLVSMDTDGFTLSFSTKGDGSAYDAISLCLDGVSSRIGTFVSSTSTGVQTVTSRHGFTPKGLLTTNVRTGGLTVPIPTAAFGIGASDFTTHRSTQLSDTDNVTTVAKSVRRTDVPWYSGSSTSDLFIGAHSSVGTTSFAVNWTTVDSTAVEFSYLLIGDAGTDTYPVTIEQSTVLSATGTAYSNQKKMVTLSTGRKWMVRTDSTGAEFEYSDDNLTWTNYAGAAIAGWTDGSIASYVDTGGTEYLVAVWKQTGTGGGRTTLLLYVMCGAFNSTRTTVTWGSATSLGAATDVDFPDLVVTPEGTGAKIHILYARYGATYNWVNHVNPDISSSGVISGGSTTTISADYVANQAIYPSIDIDKSTKRLHAAWSAGLIAAGKGIRYMTASYSGGTWTWGSEVQVDATRKSDQSYEWTICRYDLFYSRAIIVLNGDDGTNGDVIAYISSSDFTTFTTAAVFNDAIGANRFAYGSMAVSSITGDIYIFGLEATLGENFGYVKLTRTAATTFTIGTPVIIDSTLYASLYANIYYSRGVISIIYNHGVASPYAVRYDQIALYTPQKIVPDGDITTTGWTDQSGGTTSLYSVVDETTINDADYVKITL